MSLTKEEVQALIKESLEQYSKGIEELLQPVVDELTENVKTYLDQSVAPLENQLAQLAANPKEAPKEASPEASNDPLAKRLAAMEAELQASKDREAAQQQKEAELRFEAALGKSLNGYQTEYRDTATELLKSRLAGAKEKDGEWYTPEGKKIDEAVKGFFDTPVGKHLLPANYSDGAGVEKPGKVATASAKPSTAEAIAQAFL